MRRALDLMVLAAVLLGAGYLACTHQSTVRGIAQMIEAKVAPCTQPLTYSVGSIDPRFHIATSSFVADLKGAEGVWEKASGKDLFQYQQSGGAVTVNLVYDERQASTDKLRSLGYAIDTSESSYHTLKNQYDALNAQVASEQSAYSAAVAAYKSAESQYNAEVDAANARGGARPAEYQKLQDEKAQLEAQFVQVKQEEAKLNGDIDTLNALATTLNQLIVQLNLNVSQYNGQGAAQGEFEEGLYQLQGGMQSIDVYEYSDKLHLIRVLAHEMGHALGLEHVEGTASIMYKINQGDSLSPSANDIAELDRACRIAQ